MTGFKQAGPNVGGITPFTASDYPGKLAATVFIQGCPWRCGYCHNPHLQERTQRSTILWSNLISFLERRVGLIDAVVFSGGEPTMDAGLYQALLQIRGLGFKTGLHTGGIYPQRLAQVLPLLDWVGMDVKTLFTSYQSITGVARSGEPALRSLQTLLASNINLECRSTAHPALISNAHLLRLGQMLADMGVTSYAVQVFRAVGCQDTTLSMTMAAGYPCPQVIAKLESLFPHFALRRS